MTAILTRAVGVAALVAVWMLYSPWLLAEWVKERCERRLS